MLSSTFQIKQVYFSNINRIKIDFPFSFIDSSVKQGKVYKINQDGYFIVASENSLVPQFIVEFNPPTIKNLESYFELAHILNEKSCGYLWHDTSNLKSYEFIWKLGLSMLPSTLLFKWDKHADNSRFLKYDFSIKLATINDFIICKLIFSSIDSKNVELFNNNLEELILNKSLYLILKSKIIIGIANLIPVSAEYKTIDPIILLPEFRNKGYGLFAGVIIANTLLRENIILLTSMSSYHTTSFRIAKALQMIIVKQAYIVKLFEVG